MKTTRWLVLALIPILLAGCGQAAETVVPGPAQVPGTTATPTQSPAPLHTGVTILADGLLQAAQPALPLAFETGGRLLALHVRAGDRVQVGDPIATLDDTGAREQVAQAELNLQLAELALDDLARGADAAALASARASLASARAGLASANSSLAALTAPPGELQVLAARQSLQGAKQALLDLLDLPDPDAVQIAKTNLTAAEMQVQAAQAAYDRVAHLDSVAMTGEAINLWQATTDYERAQAEYNEALEGATEDQIATARAQVSLAQAELDALQEAPDPEALAAAEAQVVTAEAQVQAAQAALDALLAGPSASDTATAEANVAQARLALESAQRGLAAVELVAPAPGTVLSIHAAPGALVGAGSPIVTLLDISQLEFHTTNLSERDLAQIAPGQAAVVTLKSYPGESIEATVVRIGLQAGPPVGDAATFPVVLALATTDLDLRPGMTGRAEIHSGP
ncbi:MAG: HlyD family efflux transporter periplasmic adaptor subunit [Anaerolineae bacterium]|jgi:HlyD family secretion protein